MTQSGFVLCSNKRGQVEIRKLSEGATMMTSVTMHDLTPGPCVVQSEQACLLRGIRGQRASS